MPKGLLRSMAVHVAPSTEVASTPSSAPTTKRLLANVTRSGYLPVAGPRCARVAPSPDVSGGPPSPTATNVPLPKVTPVREVVTVDGRAVHDAPSGEVRM